MAFAFFHHADPKFKYNCKGRGLFWGRPASEAPPFEEFLTLRILLGAGVVEDYTPFWKVYIPDTYLLACLVARYGT